MKRIFWILSICALSFSMAFSQDDSYYQGGNTTNKGDNNYNDDSRSIPPSGYNANNGSNSNQPVNPEPNNGVDITVSGNYNAQPAYQAPNNVPDNSGANNNQSGTVSPDPNSNVNNYADNGNNNYNSQPDNQYTANNSNSVTPDYQSFHDQLSPYGTWVNYPGYGNVWVPNQVPADFSPYVTGGHWVYTSYGWTWASDYAWGWGPFHYGRWFNDDTYGWMWLPGYQWSPACVSWGNYGNYYCWAPLAPYGYFSGGYRPAHYWNFVDRAHFCEGNLGFYMANRSIYGRGDYRGIYAGIHVITDAHTFGNRSYFSGPRAGEVARYTGRNVTAVGINNVNHAVAPRFSGGQVYNQNAYTHGNVQQGNHYTGSSQQRSPAYSGNSHSTTRINNGGNTFAGHQNFSAQSQRPSYQRVAPQAQRQTAQHYSQPSRQSYNAPQQRSYQRSQPVQRQTERNFASAQRSSSHGSSLGSGRSSGGASHGGRR